MTTKIQKKLCPTFKYLSGPQGTKPKAKDTIKSYNITRIWRKKAYVHLTGLIYLYTKIHFNWLSGLRVKLNIAHKQESYLHNINNQLHINVEMYEIFVIYRTRFDINSILIGSNFMAHQFGQHRNQTLVKRHDHAQILVFKIKSLYFQFEIITNFRLVVIYTSRNLAIKQMTRYQELITYFTINNQFHFVTLCN